MCVHGRTTTALLFFCAVAVLYVCYATRALLLRNCNKIGLWAPALDYDGELPCSAETEEAALTGTYDEEPQCECGGSD